LEKTFRNEKKRSEVTIYQVVYRSRAQKQYRKIRRELQRYYRSTPIKFPKNLNSKLEPLKVNPKMYPIYQENPNKRRIPLKYNYYLTYIIKENMIYISDILNSRNFQLR
jgi:hypothetical protein